MDYVIANPYSRAVLIPQLPPLDKELTGSNGCRHRLRMLLPVMLSFLCVIIVIIICNLRTFATCHWQIILRGFAVTVCDGSPLFLAGGLAAPSTFGGLQACRRDESLACYKTIVTQIV